MSKFVEVLKKNKKILLCLALILLIFIGIRIFVSTMRNKHPSELVLYGNVDIRQVDLGFRVFGKVESLYFDEGDVVKAGQLMATLEQTPYLEEVAQAAARVAAVEASFTNAESRFLRREEVIAAAIAREDYDNALYNYETLKATLKEAKASLASSETSLQDTELYCPTDGSVLTRIREPGSVVNTGEPVFTLSLDSPIWIRAYVSEPNLGKIYPGMKAEIVTDTDTLPSYEGHIGFISPVAEFTPKNVETTDLRTDLVYRLRVIIDHPNCRLRQGMPVTVKLKLSSAKENECSS